MAFRNPPAPPAPELPVIEGNDQAGAAYQLVATDAGKVIRMTNAGANTVTVPADATVDFPVGTVIEVQQVGAGKTTIAAAGGVSVSSPTGIVTVASVGGFVSLRKSAANTWEAEGRLDTSQTLPVTTQAASYQLVLADAGSLIKMNAAAANTLTIPTDATAAFPVGTTLSVIQYGAGQTTIAGAGGVTVRSPDGALKITSQYGQATLIKIAADEWAVEGRLSL